MGIENIPISAGIVRTAKFGARYGGRRIMARQEKGTGYFSREER
jgi:hypothetical protein